MYPKDEDEEVPAPSPEPSPLLRGYAKPNPTTRLILSAYPPNPPPGIFCFFAILVPMTGFWVLGKVFVRPAKCLMSFKGELDNLATRAALKGAVETVWSVKHRSRCSKINCMIESASSQRNLLDN